MKKLLVGLFSFVSVLGFSNSSINLTVKGLNAGDSSFVYVQQSSEFYFYKKFYGTGKDTTLVFNNLPNGKWAVKLDATGYYFPGTQTIELQDNDKEVIYTLTPIVLENTLDYEYVWQDDSSYIGHAQQSYLNEPEEITIQGNSFQILDDFNGVELLFKYGIVLSNLISEWTTEDMYRLNQTILTLPNFNQGKPLFTGNLTPANSVWKITDNEIPDDIHIEEIESIKYVTLSRKAMTNSLPFIGTLDGVKGKFFSKRLHKAIVSYLTNFGTDKNAINNLARDRFGVEFLIPDEHLEGLMSETKSNFQEFSAFEKITILSMFEEMPEGMHKLANLKYLVRRIEGQLHPLPEYRTAAAIAWTGNNTIEFIYTAFNQIDKSMSDPDISSIQRLILHEKAHFLWAGLFDQQLKDDWAAVGDWFLDPTSPSGWTTPNTTEFVSAYAHLKNPNEDMAESIAFYVTNPDKLRSVSIRKFEFIRDRVMHGTRYISQIRQDLTFQVYNLYPDYNYPGKIRQVEVKVVGEPDEDKILTIRIYLNAVDSLKDGAARAVTRIFSSIGTLYDVGMYPIDDKGFVLEGSRTISKFAKSGYWFVNQINIFDAVGNARFENNSNFGLKIFMNNPFEDILAPKFIDGSLKLVNGNGFFESFQPSERPNGDMYQTLTSSFSVREINKLGYVGLNFNLPKMNEEGVYIGTQFGVMGNESRYLIRDSIDTEILHVNYNFPIPEYFPTGYYSITQSYLIDEAQNDSRGTFSKDTVNLTVGKSDTKHLRDSIYIATRYPDFISPEIDINNITIKATPTNSNAPNGETLFEMEFYAKDSSVYVDQASGISRGHYILRDPQGNSFNFGFDDGKAHLLKDTSVISNEWRLFKVSTLLPVGSAPGLWGVESISISDRALNTKYYDFKEIIRFDLETADSSQLVNPIIEINGKYVNKKNVDKIGFTIKGEGCAGKLYRARFYSLMGGRSQVVEGTMYSDSIYVPELNLREVNDGILYATVFIMDSTRTLLGIGKTKYTKDTVLPKDYLLKTNYQNLGTANIDQFIVEVETVELNGEIELEIYKSDSAIQNQILSAPSKVLNAPFKITAASDTLRYKLSIDQMNFDISTPEIQNLSDGEITIKLIITDSVGNEGEPVYQTIIKKSSEILTELTENKFNLSISNTVLSDLQIQHDTHSAIEVIIYNLAGNLIHSQSMEANQCSINLGHLSAGYYILKLHSLSNPQNHMEKIIRKVNP